MSDQKVNAATSDWCSWARQGDPATGRDSIKPIKTDLFQQFKKQAMENMKIYEALKKHEELKRHQEAEAEKERIRIAVEKVKEKQERVRMRIENDERKENEKKERIRIENEQRKERERIRIENVKRKERERIRIENEKRREDNEKELICIENHKRKEIFEKTRKIVAGEQASSYTYDSSRPSQNCAEERKMQILREQERRHREAMESSIDMDYQMNLLASFEKNLGITYCRVLG